MEISRAQQIVGNKYIVTRWLGGGAAGDVFRAKVDGPQTVGGRASGSSVAIKILNPGIVAQDHEIERIQRELDTGASLNHPHLLHIVEASINHDSPFLVMEYIEGPTLEQWLFDSGRVRAPGVSGRSLLSLALASLSLTILEALASGLEKLHSSRIIHRDLKPGNVLVGPGFRPVISDFGVVGNTSLAGPFTLASHQKFLGTYRYAAPECVDQRAPIYTEESDLYSLGAILYELIVGSRIFEGAARADSSNLEQAREILQAQKTTGLRKVGRDLVDIALALLQSNPEDRWTLSELKKRIGDVKQGKNRECRRYEFPLKCGWLEPDREDRDVHVLHRSELENNKLPRWSFCILVLLPDDKRPTLHFGRGKTVLNVSTETSQWGIVSNRGKARIDWCYPHSEDAASEDARIHNLLLMHDGLQKKKEEIGGNFPLRWASGGVLPIAVARGTDKEFAVLFFRDIKPRGWNLCNGASESFRDMTVLRDLVVREFAEELILLKKSSEVVDLEQIPFRDERDQSSAASYLQVYKNFLMAHTELRQEHDTVNIRLREGNPRQYRVLKTPFEVKVADDADPTRQVIFSVNTEEFGVEIIRLFKFTIDLDDERLIDGEIAPHPSQSPRWLVRRPVVLIDLAFLKENLSRATTSTDPQSRGCKVLPVMNASDFHLFFDINERRYRAENATDANEKKFSSEWLSTYGTPFEQLGLGMSNDDRLRTLTPVVWKTLELALKHGCL